MADDSELDYVRTFLGAVHTAMTFKSFSETKVITAIDDTQRGLVYPPELMSATDNYTIKRFDVLLSETNEANLTTAISNILAGIKKLNRREAITSYTRPAVLCNIKLMKGTKAWEHSTTKRWNQTIILDIMWSV